jgi:hypothetical protein
VNFSNMHFVGFCELCGFSLARSALPLGGGE